MPTHTVTPTKKKSVLMTGKELMALKVAPQEWIVDGLLRVGRKRSSLIVSQPEAGKSSLARVLAVSIVKGKPFLGRPTVQSDVIYWMTEDSPEDLQDSLRRLGYDPNTDKNILVFNGEPSENTIHTLNGALEEYPSVRLVIIETMNDLLKFEDNKNWEARKAYDAFHKAVVSKHFHRVAFLGLAHRKKRDTKNSGDGIAGATEIRGRTDGKWYVNVKSDDDQRRIFHTQVRKGENIPPTYLEYDKQTEAISLGISLAEERKLGVGVTRDKIKKQILEYFATHPGTTFNQDCLPNVEGHNDLKRRLFKELLSSGCLAKSGDGTKNSPYVFRIVEIQSEVELKEAA